MQKVSNGFDLGKHQSTSLNHGTIQHEDTSSMGEVENQKNGRAGGMR